MIHRQHDEIEFECDDCGEILETFEKDWGSALQKLKNEGWRSVKIADQWEHLCGECYDKREY